MLEIHRAYSLSRLALSDDEEIELNIPTFIEKVSEKSGSPVSRCRRIKLAQGTRTDC